MKPLEQATALLQVARDLIETDARFRDPAERRNIDRLEDAAERIGEALIGIEPVWQPISDDDYERAAEDAARIADARAGFTDEN